MAAASPKKTRPSPVKNKKKNFLGGKKKKKKKKIQKRFSSAKNSFPIKITFSIVGSTNIGFDHPQLTIVGQRQNIQHRLRGYFGTGRRWWKGNKGNDFLF